MKLEAKIHHGIPNMQAFLLRIAVVWVGTCSGCTCTRCGTGTSTEGGFHAYFYVAVRFFLIIDYDLSTNTFRFCSGTDDITDSVGNSPSLRGIDSGTGIF